RDGSVAGGLVPPAVVKDRARTSEYRIVVRPAIAIVPVYLRSEPELDVLLKCLVSLQATAPDAQVLIVDDHSPAAGLAQMVEAAAEELGQAYVRKDENSGCAATVN